MDKESMPVGGFAILTFLLIGLIVMGCMLYWQWSHHKKHVANSINNARNGNASIYEKNNPRTYNRSTSLIITANMVAQPYTGSDAENGSIVHKQ